MTMMNEVNCSSNKHTVLHTVQQKYLQGNGNLVIWSIYLSGVLNTVWANCNRFSFCGKCNQK